MDTVAIREIFSRIAAIPRCSGYEDGVARFLLGWAEKAGFESDEDAAGNVFISRPGRGGGESAPAIVLQAHMDWSCGGPEL